MMESLDRSHDKSRRLTATLLLAAAAVMSMALTAGPVFGVDRGVPGPAELQFTGDEDPITVKVMNNNWLDMRLYAVVKGRRWRIGTAYTGRQVVVDIPAHLRADILPLELVASPIGGSGSAETGELLVSTGDQIDWVLENNLAMSRVLMVRAVHE